MIGHQAFYEKRAASRHRELARHYQTLVQRFYRFLVPPGSRVLELGCSSGELLAAVEPVRGIGVDFSPAIIELARQHHPQLEFHVADVAAFSTAETFDYILMSDLVNDLPDVQELLNRAHQFAAPRNPVGVQFLQQPVETDIDSGGKDRYQGAHTRAKLDLGRRHEKSAAPGGVGADKNGYPHPVPGTDSAGRAARQSLARACS